MEKVAGHTATPWTAWKGPDGVWVLRASYIKNGLRHTAFPATVHCGAQPNEANAAFIVRAVNSHDELVAALKIARECIAYCRRAHKGAQSGEGIPVEMIIDAALSRATKQEG